MVKLQRAVRYNEVVSHPFPGVTIIDYLPPGSMRPLQKGDEYRLSPDCETGDTVFEVLGVTAASALIRSKARTTRVATVLDKKTGEDKVIEFDVPQRGVQVSRFSSVLLVEKGEQD